MFLDRIQLLGVGEFANQITSVETLEQRSRATKTRTKTRATIGKQTFHCHCVSLLAPSKLSRSFSATCAPPTIRLELIRRRAEFRRLIDRLSNSARRAASGERRASNCELRTSQIESRRKLLPAAPIRLQQTLAGYRIARAQPAERGSSLIDSSEMSRRVRSFRATGARSRAN